MEALLILFVLGAIGLGFVPFVMSVLHAKKIRDLQSAIDRLTQRISTLELQPRDSAPPAAPRPAPVVAPEPAAAGPPAVAAPVSAESEPRRVTPPPLPWETAASAGQTPPPLPRSPRTVPAIDWENFLGVKLFAWLGGFALFLGVVFLVKYSFQNNLISPFARVSIGGVIGLALVAAGWMTAQRSYRVPGQSLCATGVLVLYAAAFGAHSFYALISLTTAFLFMSVITVSAFMLAVRLDAQVIVVLGLAGGFLTPPLLTSGENALRLFGYVALLNAGIAAVSIRKRWDYLVVLGAIGTIFMQWAWLPLDAPRAVAGFWVFLALQAQFLAVAFIRQKLEPAEPWSTRSAVAVGCSSLLFAFWLLNFESLARSPGFFFSFTFLADIGLLALALVRPNPARIASAAGVIVFAVLASWTAVYLENRFLIWALGAYFLFALVHAGFFVWPARATALPPSRLQARVPLLALVLLLFAVWHGETSPAVWLCVLLVNGVALTLAWRVRSMATLLFALLVTLLTCAVWIFTAPPSSVSIPGLLAVIGGFGVLFAGASMLLGRSLGVAPADTRRNVPAIAAAMPFILLLMLIAKLPVPNPTLVFIVTLLMAVVLLGLAILARSSWVAAIALAFTWAVEFSWHTLHFRSETALLVLGWYALFWLVFAAFPLFSREERSALPWATSALSGVLHFWLIYDLIASAYPHLRTGLLPLVFALPYLLGTGHLVLRRGVEPASGDARLAWQGGAALLFLSLIFPVQFEREWITLGWALEGLALLVMFRRVPNAGLRIIGAALLSVAFVRLALNPAVLEYHPRAGVRIWNWYLYAYGLTTLCLFAGARSVHRFGETGIGRFIPRLLYTLGSILAFLLLNIQIADYFSVGPTLTFSFTGDFARDMTYSIAWALFAFALLIVGMKKRVKAVRYAGLALLLVTLLKLFLHDLANLGQLYRIGAFIGVALILIIASFVYQRFLRPAGKDPA